MSSIYENSLETVALDEAGEPILASSTDSQGFPIRVDARFHMVKRLGRGGSGLVYQAYDDVLQRHVALKFLIHSSPQRLPTLVAEARAQATVDHPYICPIYEVLETPESVYLVMQFVDGQPLQEICTNLSLEQNLLLIAKAAEGLHASHSLGIVHRDVKPMNVMIRSDEQGMHPLLVDFGLACSTDREQQEKQGSTPRFSAPEQHITSANRNQTAQARIDRRADVYALGATLFFCLTGKLPPTADEIQKRVLRLSHPMWQSLPVDVRLIIRRCMQYSPTDRYDTAVAVANDIQHFLNGEPISTRKSKLYRIGKKLVKHKWLTIASSLVFIVSTSALIHQQIEAARHVKREQTLVAFNDQIKALEYEVLLTLSAPRHNISTKREQWQQQVNSIIERLPLMDAYLHGSAHYAIGRSYLVMHNVSSALTHLKKAHTLEATPKTSFYLAMAYSGMYRRALDRIRAIENDKVRKARLADAQRNYRAPAIALLQANLFAAPFPSYASALLAYLQDDWQQVLRIFNEANDLPNWFYRDDLLKGDIALAQASAQHEAGASLVDVLPLIELAEQNYQAAAQIAPSDPWVATKPYTTALFDLRAHIQAGKVWPETELEKRQKDFVSLIDIDIRNPEIYAIYGQLAHFYGLNLHYTDGDATPWFGLAKIQLRKANALSDSKEKYWMALGRLYSSEVKLLRERNADFTMALQSAIHALEQVPESLRDYYYFNEMGTLNRHKAIALQQRGEDAQPTFRAAIEYYVAANRLFPEHIGSLINAASTLQLSSNNDSPEKRQAALVRAKTLVKKALEGDEKHFVANYYLANFELETVRLYLYNDKDATRALDAATAQMIKTQAINPEHPYLQDIALRLKRYHIENEFNQTVQWRPQFLELINERRALHQAFPNNTTVMSNYIGVSVSVIAMCLHLGMDVDSLIETALQDIHAFPTFNNVNAYHALLTLFLHWHEDDYNAKELVSAHKLRDDSSLPAQWAKAVIQAFDAQSLTTVNTAEKRIMENTGLLPVYKKQLVAWMRQKAAKLE